MAEVLRFSIGVLKIPGKDEAVSFFSRFRGSRKPTQPALAAELVIEQPVAVKPFVGVSVSLTAQGIDLMRAIQESRDDPRRTFISDFNWRLTEGIFQSLTIEDKGVKTEVHLCKDGTAILTDLTTLKSSEQDFTGEDFERWKGQRITPSPTFPPETDNQESL